MLCTRRRPPSGSREAGAPTALQDRSGPTATIRFRRLVAAWWDPLYVDAPMAARPRRLPVAERDPRVDDFLRDGCGRCERAATPACKVNDWREVLVALRVLALESGLVEDRKWGFPCYTLDGKNVLMVTVFKEHAALSFFKGAAMTAGEGLLEAPGASSRFMRLLKVRSVAELRGRRPAAKALIEQAIALERAGTKVDAAPASEPVPDELNERLSRDRALRRAFDALTPGRRRSHILHVAGAKQPETRARRVDKCAEAILAGRGFNER